MTNPTDTIRELRELLNSVLNSDMAQMAEDEGRVVTELEAIRQALTSPPAAQEPPKCGDCSDDGWIYPIGGPPIDCPSCTGKKAGE